MPLPTLAQRYLFSIAEADRIVIGARNRRQIEASITDWQLGKLSEALFEAVTDTLLKEA